MVMCLLHSLLSAISGAAAADTRWQVQTDVPQMSREGFSYAYLLQALSPLFLFARACPGLEQAPGSGGRGVQKNKAKCKARV